MIDFTSAEWDKKFRSILADIDQHKCIVLIGPEIVKIGQQPFKDTLRRQLQQTNLDDIAHYYDRDDFFLFRDKIAKEDIRREIVLFYEEHNTDSDVDESLYLDIARLKVHLVLSINPDRFVSDVAFKYGIKHRFAYFQHGGEAVQDVEPPTTEIPLFYNLFGSIEKDESLVLDYDDLFKLLSSLLGTPGLPPNLALSLQQAKHFLFVGFDFNKWYSQILLRILSGEKAIRKFAIAKSERNESTTIFLVKQFGIEFIEDEITFWKELIRRAEQVDLIKNIAPVITPEFRKIAQLLSNGMALEALTKLSAIEKHKQTVTLLMARYHDLKDRELRNVIDRHDFSIEYNKLVDAAMEMLNSKD